MARAEWHAFISTGQWMARYKFEVQAKRITARCRPPHCASMENAFARRCPTRLCNRASILSASVPTPSGGRSLDLVLRIVISRGLKNASCAVGANIDHSRKLLTSSDVTTHEVLDVRLVSYGPSQTDNYRQVGNYVGRILKDRHRSTDIQSSKVELIINLKTAKALGITVPLPLLGRADGVIQ